MEVLAYQMLCPLTAHALKDTAVYLVKVCKYVKYNAGGLARQMSRTGCEKHEYSYPLEERCSLMNSNIFRFYPMGWSLSAG